MSASLKKAASFLIYPAATHLMLIASVWIGAIVADVLSPGIQIDAGVTPSVFWTSSAVVAAFAVLIAGPVLLKLTRVLVSMEGVAVASLKDHLRHSALVYVGIIAWIAGFMSSFSHAMSANGSILILFGMVIAFLVWAVTINAFGMGLIKKPLHSRGGKASS